VRRDIQALRGFSILVVLLYHAQFIRLTGGFLGVDIFFVISGFVITSKLMEGEGSFVFQIKEFYLRRAKRILPASLSVTVLTALVAVFFLPAISRSRFSQEALSSALFSTNLHFARLGNDYLAQSADPSPYLHYWSLGVEEQFYLIWPILFLLLYKGRKNLLIPTLVITATGAIWFTAINPVVSFYLPFTRFWEFFAGILIAMNPQWRLSKPLRFPTAIFGWSTIIFAVFWVKTTDATPGVTTIIAIVGAVLVLLAHADVRPQLMLPALGDYSFSLYLVHWPVVVYFMDRRPELTLNNKALIIAISLLLSFALTRFIERPLRFQKRFILSLPQWGAVIAAGSALSFGILSISSAAMNTKTFDKSTPITYSDGCHLAFGVAWPTHECAYGDLTSSREVILAGDSHAAQWFPALNILARENKFKLVNLTKSSCPAITLETARNGKFDSSCAIWQVKVLNKIAADKPSLVILSDFTEYKYALNKPNTDYVQAWSKGLNQFLQAISSPVAFIGDTPKPTTLIGSFRLSRSSVTSATENVVRSMRDTYINPTDWLCSSQCSNTFLGKNTYRDLSHISVWTSQSLSKKLGQALSF